MPDDLYYDPYDFEIDVDPYPVWKRMRDEAPLYYNEKYDFYAVSRFDDVERCSVDWRTYISGRGSVLEMIKMGVDIPPGSILFEDPPTHDIHRSLLSRVFTPRRIAEIEPKVRAFCAASLEPLVGAGGFDFIGDLGAQMPMRTIGMLLGIPEEDQEALRDQPRLRHAAERGRADRTRTTRWCPWPTKRFAEYIDWRAEHPSDDLMTELLNAEFEDHTGVTPHAHARGDPRVRRSARRRRQRDDDAASSVGRARCWPRTPTSAGRSSRTAASSRTRSRSCCATRRRHRCSPGTSRRTSSTTGRRSRPAT